MDLESSQRPLQCSNSRCGSEDPDDFEDGICFYSNPDEDACGEESLVYKQCRRCGSAVSAESFTNPPVATDLSLDFRSAVIKAFPTSPAERNDLSGENIEMQKLNGGRGRKPSSAKVVKFGGARSKSLSCPEEFSQTPESSQNSWLTVSLGSSVIENGYESFGPSSSGPWVKVMKVKSGRFDAQVQNHKGQGHRNGQPAFRESVSFATGSAKDLQDFEICDTPVMEACPQDTNTEVKDREESLVNRFSEVNLSDTATEYVKVKRSDISSADQPLVEDAKRFLPKHRARVGRPKGEKFKRSKSVEIALNFGIYGLKKLLHPSKKVRRSRRQMSQGNPHRSSHEYRDRLSLDEPNTETLISHGHGAANNTLSDISVSDPCTYCGNASLGQFVQCISETGELVANLCEICQNVYPLDLQSKDGLEIVSGMDGHGTSEEVIAEAEYDGNSSDDNDDNDGGTRSNESAQPSTAEALRKLYLMQPCIRCGDRNSWSGFEEIPDHDGFILMRFCKECGTSSGVDDCMKAQDLVTSLKEGKVALPSCQCGNENSHDFVFAKDPESGTSLKCLKCSRFSIPIEKIEVHSMMCVSMSHVGQSLKSTLLSVESGESSDLGEESTTAPPAQTPTTICRKFATNGTTKKTPPRTSNGTERNFSDATWKAVAMETVNIIQDGGHEEFLRLTLRLCLDGADMMGGSVVLLLIPKRDCTLNKTLATLMGCQETTAKDGRGAPHTAKWHVPPEESQTSTLSEVWVVTN